MDCDTERVSCGNSASRFPARIVIGIHVERNRNLLIGLCIGFTQPHAGIAVIVPPKRSLRIDNKLFVEFCPKMVESAIEILEEIIAENK